MPPLNNKAHCTIFLQTEFFTPPPDGILLTGKNVDSQLEDAHQDRKYVTQKPESDYAFFCRLTVEERTNFWFENEALFFSGNYLDMTTPAAIQPTTKNRPQTGFNLSNTIRGQGKSTTQSPQRR
ncbi:hypothetical protein [Photorhabdus asymbiotica]|uniref:hypothetical protein n=1 Tax=Photorhabdus asymbiotica TaxID=291112 RepID=UPI003DA7547E